MGYAEWSIYRGGEWVDVMVGTHEGESGVITKIEYNYEEKEWYYTVDLCNTQATKVELLGEGQISPTLWRDEDVEQEKVMGAEAFYQEGEKHV
jgi:hypothetical protein